MSVHEAICARHSKDLIVGECKDGPTWNGSHLRLDYWVLRRSWSNPAMIGYEVKSSRADFLKDNKWQGYLPLCNELWFVQEKAGAIAPAELPESVGLLRLAGSRLITMRKAVWREVPCPEGLLTYILMCRAKIEHEHRNGTGEADRWRAWLDEKEDKRAIGYNVSKALRAKYEKDVEQVRRENERLRSEQAQATRLRQELDALGIKLSTFASAKDIADELRAPRWTRQQVQQVVKDLTALLAAVTPQESGVK